MSSVNALSIDNSASDRQVIYSFKCPESIQDPTELENNYAQFTKSILIRHPDWTAEQFAMFRYALLELHECERTLENIRQNLHTSESEGMYVVAHLLPKTSYTADCFRPEVRKLDEAAQSSNIQNLRDEASTNKDKLTNLIDMAMKGNAYAQFYLATLYDPSLSNVVSTLAKDWSAANRWYEKAATKGLPEAEYSLGNSYARGSQVTQDSREAVYWYRLAAEHGYVAAEWNLAVAYETGQGIRPDNMRANNWYCTAALAGDQASQWHMVHIYLDKEITGNFDHTTYWLSVLQKEGDAGAKMLLDYLGLTV